MLEHFLFFYQYDKKYRLSGMKANLSYYTNLETTSISLPDRILSPGAENAVVTGNGSLGAL